ncbi:MAG: lipoprotein NlpD [Gammaproteobacteria bacterium]
MVEAVSQRIMNYQNQRRFLLLFICLLASLLNSSCSSNSVAPVSTRGANQDAKSVTGSTKSRATSPSVVNKKKSHHIVSSGDTLYSISWDYDLDYREVARWNNIKKPYVIYPRQAIRLIAPFSKKTIGKKIEPANKIKESEKTAKKQPEAVKKTTKTATPVKFANKINWQWPTTGKLIKSNLPISKKGLDIAGKKGQPIKTSAAGIVVYSGSGLLGYGRLIIIKHNETFLSAYAHNSVLLVKEGDSVSSEQKIAEMGQDSNGQVLLHFEIRKNGNPVAPLSYLPRN